MVSDMVKRRRYVELFMGPLDFSENIDSIVEKCMKYSELCKFYGYSYCVATFEITEWRGRWQSIFRDLRKRGCADAIRADVVVENTREALNIIRRARRIVELLSIRGVSRQLIALASRDKRVDIVSVIPGVSPPLYRGDIQYIKSKEGIVEIGIGGLKVDSKGVLTRQLAAAQRLVSRVGSDVRIAVTVAGGTCYRPREPRNIIDFGTVFLGLNKNRIRDVLSVDSLRLIEKNRKKMLGLIPVEGVEIEESKEKVSNNYSTP